MEEIIRKCHLIGCQGEKDRGNGGLIYCDDEEVGYVFLNELNLPNTEFTEKIRELIEENSMYFVIIMKQDNALHVSKVAKFLG